MKKKIFIISILFLLCTLINSKEAFAVTVYDENGFRTALSQGQTTITIGNSINFYSAININYNVTINAGSNDNALRCMNSVSSFITVASGKTLTLRGVVVDLRSNVASAGINGIKIPSGAKMTFDGSLIDGGMNNTGLLIESGGAVTVTRGDFVYSKYGVRVKGTGTLTHSNSGGMNFWNNNIGLLYESSATCNIVNSNMYNNSIAMQVSSGTVNFKGGNIYNNSWGAYAAGGTTNHTGGTIYSNTSHGAVVRNGTYNLAGGTIKNNSQQGVILDTGYNGIFKMTSGTISGNASNAIYNAQSGDRCIVQGGTVSGWIYLALADNYVTTNTSYPTLSVKPSSYSFKRKLVKTNSNAYANNEIGKVTMAASGSWYKYVDGQYIVVWTGGNVIVKCVDLGNNAVLSTQTKNGTIGTTVTLTDPSITGYALVSRPSTTTYTYAQADQTATYGFKKISNLIVKYIDVNTNEVMLTETIPLKEGDSYTASAKEITGYKNTSKPSTETITMARANIELVYSYKKISDGVDVKYVDQVTGDEIAATEHKDGLEKDSYTTSAKTIDGYELVLTPNNANGEMAVDLITVTYEYRKNSNVIVKYLDENHNTYIADDLVTKYKEGDSYTTTEKDIDGYQLTGNSSNVLGTVERTNIEVTYKYKKISDGVDVKYVDQVTGDELVSEHIDGLEKDSYTTEAKDIDGYELVKTPDNTTGEMTVDLITVTYEYRKNSNVIVKFIDENYNTEISEQVITKYKEGDLYTTAKKDITGYELTSQSDNTSGTVVRANIEVTYKYKKISDGVDVKYVDQANGEELASEHIDGLEKDSYTTEAKDIDGYELVKTPDNTNGEMTVELITVTYEYRKNSYVTVKYIDQNNNKELVTQIVTKYKEGDLYTTEEKSIFGYELIGTTDNTSGTVDRENIEVIYKYKKTSDGAYISYIDQVTGDELAETIHIDGLEKDPYTSEAKDIDGYELVVTPDNADGVLTVGKVTVVYEYRKNSYVTTKYIDENYGSTLTSDVVAKYKEGDIYSTEEKKIDGYKLTNKTTNTSGTVVRDNIEVVYKYKKISQGVDIKHIDQVTGEELAFEHIDGLEKDSYTTEAKDIEGYELVLTPDNTTGEMIVDLTTVTYEYRKNSNVTVKYIYENYGTDIITNIITKYKEGDSYTTEEKTFDGYKLTGKTTNTSGTVEREDIVVEYKYKKISAGVDTKFIDQVTGEEIADTEYQGGLEKDSYTTEAKTIDGYELVFTPDNAKGEMAVDLITVTYEYRKNSNVTVKYIDENYNTNIIENIVTKYKEGD
ncbi:MAG: MucBP domain-containing protein, partial [Clostridia bacterium]|nr:MucBP domain-containing protein [Clostridia bacterium]